MPVLQRQRFRNPLFQISPAITLAYRRLSLSAAEVVRASHPAEALSVPLAAADRPTPCDSARRRSARHVQARAAPDVLRFVHGRLPQVSAQRSAALVDEPRG